MIRGCNEDEEEAEDDSDVGQPMVGVSKLVGLMGSLAEYQKTFRMIEFINKQVKDGAKKYNCNKDFSNLPVCSRGQVR